ALRVDPPARYPEFGSCRGDGARKGPQTHPEQSTRHPRSTRRTLSTPLTALTRATRLAVSARQGLTIPTNPKEWPPMARKITTTKTAEQRRAQAQRLQESIVEQVAQLRDSTAWQQFLAYVRAFHSYSVNNLMLIAAQHPGASQVAGFRKWQSLGRQVRKGEHAIKIFGFAKKKITDDSDNTGDDEERVKIYYPVLSVFDISQTDPIEGADDTPDPVELAPRLTGDDPLGIIDA